MFLVSLKTPIVHFASAFGLNKLTINIKKEYSLLCAHSRHFEAMKLMIVCRFEATHRWPALWFQQSEDEIWDFKIMFGSVKLRENLRKI